VNKICPICSTEFKIGPRDEGKQFVCFKCNTTLTVTRDGIQAAGAPAVVPSTTPLPPVSAAPLSSETPAPVSARSGPSWWRRHGGPTWLFAAGTFFVILFLFLPLIDRAKARRVKGALDLGTQREKKQEEEFKKNQSASTQDKAERALAHEKWLKDASRLEAEQGEAAAKADMAEYWYTWGMMFGFILLAGAALGYLDSTQPTIRRVVGAIVLVAEVLLIFLRFVVSLK
jgi:hypothetical protein